MNLITPLIFSTELARSVSFGRPTKFEKKDTAGATIDSIEGEPLERSFIHFAEKKAGDRNARIGNKMIKDTLVVAGLIYGLVNVRTDGETIMCATLDEKDYNWRINKIKSRGQAQSRLRQSTFCSCRGFI